jgi:hypothetical protein
VLSRGRHPTEKRRARQGYIDDSSVTQPAPERPPSSAIKTDHTPLLVFGTAV